jgi:hypothetical protein
MTSLLAVYHRDGRCVGYCGSGCYNALLPSQLKEPRRNACVCICGGANHAAGRARAIKNHEKGVGIRRSDIEAYAQIIGENPDDLVVVDRLRVQSKDAARRLAVAMLHPKPIGSDDLFYCEALPAPSPVAAHEGSPGSGSQTPDLPGDDPQSSETLGPVALSTS